MNDIARASASGGAIAESDHNDYFDFAASEQQRWSPFVVRAPDGAAVFDREKCLAFMHAAAALPLWQCAALIGKMEACALRGSTIWFRDE